MTSVYEITDISDLVQTAYRHFMNYEDEVLYILCKGKMLGVLSIGDLERFYDSQGSELKVNQRYTSSCTVDFKAAENFFDHVITMNEMPIVTTDRELLGIIRKTKEEWLRGRQRRSLEYARTGRYRYVRTEIERFINETKTRVILYKYSINEIVKSMNSEECECLEKRRRRVGTHMWKGLSAEEWETFWQSEYEDGIVDIMQQEVMEHTPVLLNGIAVFPDMRGKCFWFKNGYRVTPNNPSGADRKIYMFGPCIVMGAYCKDTQTIEAYLQNKLIQSQHSEWMVLNRGAYTPEYCYGHMFMQELSEDDTVIIIIEEKWLVNKDLTKLVFQGDLTPDFLEIPTLSSYIVDSPSHCNYIVNQKLAERIYKDINQIGLLDTSRKSRKTERLQNYYVNFDVFSYFANYLEQHGLHKGSENIQTGAIVMNCNPFTKGHRYLVDQAAAMVDQLYIFVVEEDKSYFSFEDRFKMVKEGVADITNIQVVPSGRYILSKDTFAQYFEKENIQVVDSMDYDIYIFGEIVAAELGIKFRFVGEEPFDRVTRKYNETMKRILPDFGVEVIEFPRALADEKGGIISASLVRRAIQEKDMDTIEKFCPKSTIMYLKEHENIF